MTESIKDKLLANNKPRKAPVAFCGENVFTKILTEREKIDLYLIEKAEADKRGSDAVDTHTRTRTIAYLLCDENRNLIFAPDDIDKLVDFPSAEIETTFDEIMRINSGLVIEEDVQEAKKN